MKWFEWAIVVAIGGVLVALLVPGIQWVADGDCIFPIRVIVFDAIANRPISGAHVTIFRAPPVTFEEIASARIQWHGSRETGPRDEAITDVTGGVVIDHRFRSIASHNRPTPHLQMSWEWVEVRAEGYGGVVVPVRLESRPVEEVRRDSELLVPIGLLPDRS